MSDISIISLSNPVLQSYIVHSIILALKLLSVSTLTTLTRQYLKVFSNAEDAKFFKGNVKFDDPIVERTRRAHLNDLENIPAFWIIAAFYVTTNPTALLAVMLFRVYTVCRIVHTLVYALFSCPQPIRAFAYAIPYLIKWYMGLQVVLYYITSI
ncbi:unnamed protein product [Leptidea sinapis]|uniref:Microsomal glutathione S-transferase 1 n=1 Tax=Leptidea sinapis TaxID=189913 RepID=A0A5E4Q8Y2_9NEOP|nr:unnamed protein product [Leptidea sinapis]